MVTKHPFGNNKAGREQELSLAAGSSPWMTFSEVYWNTRHREDEPWIHHHHHHHPHAPLLQAFCIRGRAPGTDSLYLGPQLAA